MTHDVVDRARQDIADARLWKARDRLTGALVHRADHELLDLLGEVHFSMAELPAAGGMWFLTGRQGPDAEAARLAWHERHGNDPLQLWLSLPPLARRNAEQAAVLELKAAAEQRARTVSHVVRVGLPDDIRPARRRSEDVGFTVVLGLTALFFIVGLVSVIRWVLPWW